MKRNKRLRIIDAICNHVINNKKEYVLVTLIFLVGIFLGVMFINNIQEAQMAEITEYLKSFTEKMKNTEKLETYSILKTTILENVILAITLWFFGTTVIGIPIVFGIILYRGFCLGYSIASIITIMGAGKVKDRNKDNIKVEVLRHTIFSSIMLGVLCIAAIIEILISTNILKKIVKYF